mmetsp:Transcript_90433/g.193907  ORF Transcript_90433/g.193907 Transcript_90433/m.193907 type:complete len:239 (+) Transcript_90433:820-1536(+)
MQGCSSMAEPRPGHHAEKPRTLTSTHRPSAGLRCRHWSGPPQRTSSSSRRPMSWAWSRVLICPGWRCQKRGTSTAMPCASATPSDRPRPASRRTVRPAPLCRSHSRRNSSERSWRRCGRSRRQEAAAQAWRPPSWRTRTRLHRPLPPQPWGCPKATLRQPIGASARLWRGSGASERRAQAWRRTLGGLGASTPRLFLCWRRPRQSLQSPCGCRSSLSGVRWTTQRMGLPRWSRRHRLT